MEISAADMMKYAVEHDILSISQVQSLHTQMEKEERQKLLDQHPYKIYEGKDRKFYCYIKEGDKRKKIKRNSRKEIEDIIIAHVKEGLAVTIADVFEEYIKHKRDKEGLRDSSLSCYREVYGRHFVKTGWSKKDIRKLAAEDFISFLEDECTSNSLPPRSFGNLKTITKGILKMAYRLHLITYPYRDVIDNLAVKSHKRQYKNQEQVYSEEEERRLTRYLEAPENRDIQNLAILFCLVSGCRVGEVVGLAFDDFFSDTGAYIRRTETKYKDENGKYVYTLGEPKTEAGKRKIFIPNGSEGSKDYSWIVKEMRRLRPDAEFLCTDKKGKRMTTNCLRRRLHRISDKLGFKYNKSIHKLRKTYVTRAKEAGVPDKALTSQVGHANSRITNEIYDVDRSTDNEKQAMSNIIYMPRAVGSA